MDIAVIYESVGEDWVPVYTGSIEETDAWLIEHGYEVVSEQVQS